MRPTLFVIASMLIAAACGKSAEEAGREAVQKDQQAQAGSAVEPAKPITMGSGSDSMTPPPTTKPAEPPAPEPTTPEEIDKARKQAMLDLRDKDVIKYCEMEKLDAKSDPQIYLGCALAACRLNDPDRAKNWSKNLPKLLMDQAVKVCLTYNINPKPAQ